MSLPLTRTLFRPQKAVKRGFAQLRILLLYLALAHGCTCRPVLVGHDPATIMVDCLQATMAFRNLACTSMHDDCWGGAPYQSVFLYKSVSSH